jgi:hypothetical protein
MNGRAVERGKEEQENEGRRRKDRTGERGNDERKSRRTEGGNEEQ